MVQERDLDDVEGIGRRVKGRALVASLHDHPPHLRQCRLFQPDAPHPVLQSCRTGRARRRHSLSQPVSRGLIDARVESLLTQGEIIAGAVSASASVDTNSITIDPEKLLELQAGQSITPVPNDEDLEFPIDPEKVAPVLRRLISPTRTRARIFDADANLLLDSRHLYSRGQVLRFDLPPVADEEQTWSEWFTDDLQQGSAAGQPAALQGSAGR
jgi:two-component system sensor histidine kinase ChvG